MSVKIVPVAKPKHKTFRDIQGQRFDRLVVVAYAGYTKNKPRLSAWYCRCDCGTIAIIAGKRLTDKNNRSCGCLLDEWRRQCTHGLRHLPEYGIWAGIKHRCRNSSMKGYGGRGIYYCKRWESFENFLDDMGRRPTDNHSIERINNSKGYSRENCKWALPFEQARNTRRNHFISFQGETLCITDWAKRLGISPTSLHKRIYKLYWPLSKALVP